MRFETRTVGVFEVLSVYLEGDEVFDAGRLRQENLRLVEKGSRRIVVDLTGIDYLYSDSINAFVALNRRLLESSGRLGILVPHPKVHEILVRAGLENIMRLYRSEADLLGDSRELMRQSSAWTRPAELVNAASASQILTTANLAPRNSTDAARELASATQRIQRRRSGPRVEVRPRRRGGRSLDQYSDEEIPLPPQLPSIGSESSTLRSLSMESSAFLNAPTENDRRQSAPPAPKPAPPPAEAKVFELPKEPQQDGYSTDAWLLALAPQTDQPPPRPSATSRHSAPPPPSPAGTESQSRFDDNL
ncbi:MAG TPA: STAS domain-containing protein, partial [Fibrobacteria bacterium]|nr:STAS domain-containing protein [Fibrobacteria bacterium]